MLSDVSELLHPTEVYAKEKHASRRYTLHKLHGLCMKMTPAKYVAVKVNIAQPIIHFCSFCLPVQYQLQRNFRPLLDSSSIAYQSMRSADYAQLTRFVKAYIFWQSFPYHKSAPGEVYEYISSVAPAITEELQSVLIKLDFDPVSFLLLGEETEHVLAVVDLWEYLHTTRYFPKGRFAESFLTLSTYKVLAIPGVWVVSAPLLLLEHLAVADESIVSGPLEALLVEKDATGVHLKVPIATDVLYTFLKDGISPPEALSLSSIL